MISHSIGLYGICEFGRKLNNSAGDTNENISTDCMDSANNLISNMDMTIAGLSIVFAFELIWLLYWWWMACPKQLSAEERKEIEQGYLGCGGCYLITHIFATMSWINFLFMDGYMFRFKKNCGDTELYQIWNNYNVFCYFSFAWILFQWVCIGCGFCIVCMTVTFL